MIKFTEQQVNQLNHKNITIQTVCEQLERFTDGFPVVQLDRAATINDGIMQLTSQQHEDYAHYYEQQTNNLQITKFTPASGAATRMFKFLHEFLKDFDPANDSINNFINRHKARDLFTFFIALDKFPFYDQVLDSVKQVHHDWQAQPDRYKKLLFVQHMLQDHGLNYGHMPKGLVPFHKYKDHCATAFEEHLFESSVYATSNQQAHLHFTIAPEFKDQFTQEFERIEHIVEHKTQMQFTIEFSHQESCTDTIAVDHNNNPIVTDDGTFLFRPAGHGALLNNLNKLEADIIFIKNIDNVTISSLENKVGFYKKSLAGLLHSIQQQSFVYLNKLDNQQITAQTQLEIEQFLQQQLCTVFPKDYHKYAQQYQIEYLHDRLNRPLRVCGMVKNEGEPGGGPYWLYNQKGELSIEIVESAQIDTSNTKQLNIVKSSTHFNPVDLVCAVRDYKGNKFDLSQFCDHNTGFITNKSRLGMPIKAQELPGLWNGGMAYWNSIFVEVPLLTFNPVKTVNDLLKPAHQN